MPLTFFAHQVPVLPLKRLKPHWFDGTALCIGSMAPDLPYALEGTPFAFGSHTLAAQWTWTLPVTLIMTRVFRGVVAAPLGASLPQPLGSEVQALAGAHRPFWQVASSALLGGLSHLFLDGFTHRNGWAVACFPQLDAIVVLPWLEVRGWKLLQYTGHVFGGALGLAMFAVLIHQRRLSAWSGAVRVRVARPPARLFLGLTAIGCGLALATMARVFATGGGPHVAIMRGSWIVAFGLLCGAIASRSAQPRV